ncbi:hypothetical protein GGI20_004507, partial [Coemansia sp. BCRC 34301]
MDADQESDYGGDDNAVEPLNWARLDKIKKSISSKASTWESLRRQYPPSQSFFAPLNLTASKMMATAGAPTSDADASLVVDEVYSQAATMAAYGFELLRIALR